MPCMREQAARNLFRRRVGEAILIGYDFRLQAEGYSPAARQVARASMLPT